MLDSKARALNSVAQVGRQPEVAIRLLRGLVVAFGIVVAWLSAAPGPESFHFVLLGDRTGEVQAGVFEHVWQEAAAEKPAFVVTIGDTIQGLNEATAQSEWEAVEKILAPYRRIPLYLTPGNHDIWSAPSEQLFRKYARHPPHYGFDYRQVHFTILDNSRSDELSAGELQFLKDDLQQHAAQPVKFILSHRPSWLLDAALGNPAFPLHQTAKQYGARYVFAGHVHQMLHAELDGVTYVSLPSAGGHLRSSGRYEDGWFFGYTIVAVRGGNVDFEIKELPTPRGQGRVTGLKDWGIAGLAAAAAAAR